MVDETPTPTPQPDEAQPQPRATPDQWRTRVLACIRKRDQLLPDWRESVNFRLQMPFAAAASDVGAPTHDRVSVPEDWARTRQKTAQLSFHVPKILAEELHPAYAAAAPIATALINDVLRRECRASHMIEEVLADVVNAAGLMTSVIDLDLRTEQVEIPGPPSLDPTTGQVVTGAPQRVTRKVHQGVTWTRFSPAALLWPAEFTGSDWDRAPWLGYETWVTLVDARRTYGAKIPADFKGTEQKPALLSDETSRHKDGSTPADYVKLQVIWYRSALYRDDEGIHPDRLHTLVLLEGIPDPIIDEPSGWQTWVPEAVGADGTPIPGHFIGLTRYPIRVGTLTYVSDLATPPSDSAAGRPQVRELMRSRSQMMRQRDAAIPVRWYDTNRLDEMVAQQIQRGEWQDMIPTNGPGDRVIGEVSRAQFPRENFEFQRIIGHDLDLSWSLSNNQLSAPNPTERSATEVNAVQNAGAVLLDFQKQKVHRYVADGAAVIFSLLQQHMDVPRYARVVGPDGAKVLQQITKAAIVGEFAFSYLSDSSERVSVETRQANTLKIYNLAINDPNVNRAALLRKMLEEFGFDPAEMVNPPTPPAPTPPKVSYAFKGEDLLNPIAVAVMMQANPLSPEQIQAASMMIQDAMKQLGNLQPAIQAGMPPSEDPAGSTPEEARVVEPPATNAPVLKRADDGSRLVT